MVHGPRKWLDESDVNNWCPPLLRRRVVGLNLFLLCLINGYLVFTKLSSWKKKILPLSKFANITLYLIIKPFSFDFSKIKFTYDGHRTMSSLSTYISSFIRFIRCFCCQTLSWIHWLVGRQMRTAWPGMPVFVPSPGCDSFERISDYSDPCSKCSCSGLA